MDANGNGGRSFLEACGHCDADAVAQLLDSHSLTPLKLNERDRTGKTGLNQVCSNGYMTILELLEHRELQIDPNLADNEGNTPLIFAAQAGASPYVRDPGRGLRALEWAEYCGRSSVAQLLGKFMEAIPPPPLTEMLAETASPVGQCQLAPLPILTVSPHSRDDSYIYEIGRRRKNVANKLRRGYKKATSQ